MTGFAGRSRSHRLDHNDQKSQHSEAAKWAAAGSPLLGRFGAPLSLSAFLGLLEAHLPLLEGGVNDGADISGLVRAQVDW
jgi:hypothetical protein